MSILNKILGRDDDTKLEDLQELRKEMADDIAEMKKLAKEEEKTARAMEMEKELKKRIRKAREKQGIDTDESRGVKEAVGSVFDTLGSVRDTMSRDFPGLEQGGPITSDLGSGPGLLDDFGGSRGYELHVVPNEGQAPYGDWVVMEGDHVYSNHRKKSSAKKSAKAEAKRNRPATVVIHRRDGTFQNEIHCDQRRRRRR